MNAPSARRTIAIAAGSGFVYFLATAVAAQILHSHAVAATPISTYLRGSASAWLQSGYYVLAVSVMLLGVRMASLDPRIIGVPAGFLLFLVACAVVLIAYTYSPWPLPGNPPPVVRIRIHILSAFCAFGGVTIVMFLVTPFLWRLRLRRLFLVLALIVLALELLGYLAPVFAAGSYGTFEKLSIAGIIFWLLGASWHLTTTTATSPGTANPCR